MRRLVQLRSNIIKSFDLLVFSLKPKQVVGSATVKFLGVPLDKKITWESHVDHLTKKLNSNFFQLQILVVFCSLDVKLFNALPYTVFQEIALKVELK